MSGSVEMFFDKFLSIRKCDALQGVTKMLNSMKKHLLKLAENWKDKTFVELRTDTAIFQS